MTDEHIQTARRLLQELHDKGAALTAFLEARQTDKADLAPEVANPFKLRELLRHAHNIEDDSGYALELLQEKA
jgi:hypothetical protein